MRGRRTLLAVSLCLLSKHATVTGGWPTTGRALLFANFSRRTAAESGQATSRCARGCWERAVARVLTRSHFLHTPSAAPPRPAPGPPSPLPRRRCHWQRLGRWPRWSCWAEGTEADGS